MWTNLNPVFIPKHSPNMASFHDRQNKRNARIEWGWPLAYKEASGEYSKSSRRDYTLHRFQLLVDIATGILIIFCSGFAAQSLVRKFHWARRYDD